MNKLDDTILKFPHEHGEMNMVGTWRGKYTYDMPDIYKDDRTREVKFTIQITQVKGNAFMGTVEDDLKTGGTRGVGKIEGNFDKGQIRFNKNMPVLTQIDQAGNHIENARKRHPTIFYEGRFAPGKQYCAGTWRFKKKRLIWKGIIPLWITPISGQFSMEKVQEESTTPGFPL
jgi:hypothetical protein